MTGGFRAAVAAAVLGAAVAASPLAAQGGEEAADTTGAADSVAQRTADGALPGDTLPEDTPPDTTPPSAQEMRRALAGGSFPERDSIFNRLAGLPGYRALEYRAVRVELEVLERRVRLRDSAQVNYGDAALRADSMVYRSRLEFLAARGDIRMASPGRRQMTSDSVLYYDVSRRKGTVLDARTSFSQIGATWNVRGNAVPVGQETVYVNTGSFTSCSLEEPHYWFSAGQIKMVNQDVIVAWPVTLYVSKVPIFWLPFFAQDIRPHRRSGILPPQFGFNDVVRTSRDFRRQITGAGYYWAISPFMDASATVDWYSGQFTRLNGNVRYHFMKDFIRGSVTASQEWGRRGKNFRIRFDHDQEITPETRFTARGQFVQSERLLRDRSVDPREQTQTIDTDVGLRHSLDFADLSVSARRRQFLGEEERVDLTLPSVNLSFSPVTLFEAPRSQAGPFNNLTWRGSASYRRQKQNRGRSDDLLDTDASLSQSLSLGRVSVSTRADVRQQEVDRLRFVTSGDPEAPDTTFVELPTTRQTTARWNASTGYQIDLMGSTTLRPSVDVSGGWFRADFPPDTVRGDTLPDTDGRFVALPTRPSFGASLSTDLFGFFPGVGPFTRIRHKISPRFQWRYTPKTTLSDPSLAEIPAFPAGGGEARNQLRVSLNQTFEAKMIEEAGGERPEAAPAVELPGDAPPSGGAFPDDTAGAAGEEGGPDPTGAQARDTIPGSSGSGGRSSRERKVTLLSIRSDALTFDFERARQGEPVLTTDRWGNSLSSDLLRGFRVNLTHDLFEGTGKDRTFDPFLAQLNASFSLSSGTELGDLVGVGGRGAGGVGPIGGAMAGPGPAGPMGAGGPVGTGGEAGSWRMSLGYSLRRSRPGEGTSRESQTLSTSLSLQPSPNWQASWRTSYNITDSEFGSHDVQLVRDLHRWQARFQFQKAPNGNFVFRFLVRLVDAPDLKVNYDQRSRPPGESGRGRTTSR